MQRRSGAVVLSICLVAALGLAAHAAPGRSAGAKPLTVDCGNIIGSSTRSHVHSGFRVVLGAISAPPARLGKGGATKDRWPYFSKSGLGVREGRGPVTITVPPVWRTRVTIGWGNNIGTSSTVRIPPCPPSPNRWNFYAGGFYTRSPICVPLTFRIGTRTHTLRFGIGRRCGHR